MRASQAHGAWWLAPLPGDAGESASPAAGLTAAEAGARLARYGPNLLHERPARSLVRQFAVRFKNPLVVILISASAVSALTGEFLNFLIIGTIVVFSVTLDFLQEYRANAAADKLRQSVLPAATVMRDGKPSVIPASGVVPGDLALLSAGDMIPADGRVLEAHDFFVKQTILTGESYPVEKWPGTLPATATDIADATNAAFMGTLVISGSARLLVAATGSSTAIGEIAESIARPAAPTAFEMATRQFGMSIMRLTVLMVMLVLLVNTMLHRPWLESFLFAVALAVGLTPELLPMIVSVTLARGALRMARQQIIVKRLTAIEDLGGMDVLCTDKTGTLTEAKIGMERHIDPLGRPSERVLELAYLNSSFETGLKSPLDEAILAHGHIDIGHWNKIDEVPFDFERRRVSVLIDDGTRRWLVVKGAPDEIAGLCTRYESEGAAQQLPVDHAALEAIRAQYRALEEQGLRVLGIAWRDVARDHPHALVNDETQLVLAGFAAFFDPPKTSAAPAIAALGQLGVSIKVLTGDSELVARHVCVQLGMPVLGILTGTQIARLDDPALGAMAEKANLFCRISPMEKNRVVLALKARGHVVGFLGDGINDAPSLHAADVGLAVDTSVDVAREAADIVLLRQDLQVLHAGILEGRRTFSNIMKYLMMVTSSNFGNMVSMAGASLFLPFLPMSPTQILLNNILYDISEVPIPLDSVDRDELLRPRKLDLQLVHNFMLLLGPVSSLFDFLTFYILWIVMQANEKLFQTGWFVESLCTQVLVIFVFRTRGNPLRARAHPLLAATALAVAGTALVLPLTPMGRIFSFVPLPIHFYLVLGALVLLYLIIAELVKQRFLRWSARQRA